MKKPHWTRKALKEPGTYFYTYKRVDGTWSTPTEEYLIEGIECREGILRWSEQVERFVPEPPGKG